MRLFSSIVISCGIIACLPSALRAQSTSERCAAANEDIPAQMAQAKDILREKHPPPPDPADFDDGCWNDPQSAATRDRIVNDWVNKLKQPEVDLIKAIYNDTHVLDTLNCWNNDVGEQTAVQTYTKLADRLEDKLSQFIQACDKKNGFAKGAYEALMANKAFHDIYLISSDHGEPIQSQLLSLFNRWRDDISDRVQKSHDFSLLKTYAVAVKGIELLGGEDQTDYINSFSSITCCEVKIDYTFNIKNNTGKFEYRLTGKQKIKYMPMVDKWVPMDFQFSIRPPIPTITMTYEEGRVYTDKGKAELKKTTTVTNFGKTQTETGMSFDTPIGLSITPCPSAQNQLEFKIQGPGSTNGDVGRSRWEPGP